MSSKRGLVDRTLSSQAMGSGIRARWRDIKAREALLMSSQAPLWLVLQRNKYGVGILQIMHSKKQSSGQHCVRPMKIHHFKKKEVLKVQPSEEKVVGALNILQE